MAQVTAPADLGGSHGGDGLATLAVRCLSSFPSGRSPCNVRMLFEHIPTSVDIVRLVLIHLVCLCLGWCVWSVVTAAATSSFVDGL